MRPHTSPIVYLQTLDSAYGTVQDSDKLYAKFMDTFQDAGEKPSHYLQRLQVALNQTVKRGGVLNKDFDRDLRTDPVLPWLLGQFSHHRTPVKATKI